MSGRPRIAIRPGSPYRPLFERGGTRYKVILSGRGARKSFTVSSAMLDRTYDDDGRAKHSDEARTRQETTPVFDGTEYPTSKEPAKKNAPF